ncbi:MAG: adenylate/guanylate cyclase domain-containing protein [Flavipsychrobacter sp.]
MGKWITIAVLLLLPAMLAAQPKVYKLSATDSTLKNINLEDLLWTYSTEDHPDMALPTYNDSNWATTDCRIDLEHSDWFKGFTWLRLHLWVDSTLTQTPLAMLIVQRGASEIYLDGKLLFKYGVINGKDSSIYYNPHSMPLTFSFDTVGKHVLAVRYANYASKESILKRASTTAGFSIRMVRANNTIIQQISEYFLEGFIIVFVVGLSFALCLLHLFLFLYYREEKSNLYFSIFCLALAFSFALPHISSFATFPSVSIALNNGFLVAMSVLAFSLTALTNDLFSESKIRFYILSALCIVPPIIGISSNLGAWIAIPFLMLLVMLEAFILTIRAIIRKKEGARIIGIGILLFTLFFLGSVLTITVVAGFKGGLVINDTNYPGLGTLLLTMAIVAILSIPVSMSVFLAWKFAKTTRNLNKQLAQVQALSEKTLAQEQEKKHLLENQKQQLEIEVAERTKEIVEEKQKSDDLLRNILPQEVAEELKEKGATEAKYYDHVSVLFTDFVNFTQAGERFSPQELVDELHACFKAFDNIISKYGIEKIKTIGDAYLAVCGLPKADAQHATKTVQAALEIRDFMRERKKQFPDKTFDIRIGIHSGPVVAGIVGVKKFAYDIWGDTVNTAARMESSSEADKINISHNTYEQVQQQYDCTYRGEITAKNKGELRMYFVEGKV